MEFSFDLTADRQHVHDAVKGLIWTVFFYRAFGSIVPSTSEFLDVPYPYFESPELEDEIEQNIDHLLSRIDSDIATPTLTSTSSTTTPLGSPGTKTFTLNSTISTGNNNLNNNNPYANIKFNDPEPLTTLDSFDDKQSSSLHSLNTVSKNLLTKSPSSMPTTSSTLQTTNSNRSTTVNNNNNNNVKFGQLAIKFYERKKLKKPTWFGKTEEEINWETWILNVRVVQKNSELHTLVDNLKLQFKETVLNISEICDQKKDHIPVITSTDLFPFPYTMSTSHGNNDSWKAFIKKMLKDPIY